MELLQSNTFGVVDYVVFSLLLLISVGIGIFFACYGKGQHTTLNYFLGDRNMNVLPVALSYVVTFQSSIMILGSPVEVYAYGMQYCLVCVGVTIAYLLAPLIVVPIFHPLKVTSVNEYFRQRYNSNVIRFLAVTLGIIYYTFYMGIVIYGTSLALESAAGFSFWISVVVFSSAAIAYTSLGGIRAVIWTDVFQTIVMTAGIMAVLAKTTINSGGLSKVFENSKTRLNFFNFNPDPTQRHTFWTLIVGAIPQFLYLTFSQSGIQRINSTPTIKTANQLYYIATPIYCLLWIFAMFQGVTIYGYYTEKGCDPLASGEVPNINQLIPFTVMELFHYVPGLPGLFIAALAAASLSTLSSGLSSLAAITYEDIIKTFFPNLIEEKATNISKIVVVIYGVIAVTIAFLLLKIEGPMGQIFVSFMGAIAGPTTGLFLLSLFNRRTSIKGAVIGVISAMTFVLWLNLGQTFSPSVKQTPFLPLGPIDQCQENNSRTSIDSMFHASMSEINPYNVSYNNNNVSVFSTSTVETSSSTREEKSGLAVLYSISYMYFDLIGVVIVLTVGSIVSLFTARAVPVASDDKYILPLSVFIPHILRQKCGKKNDIQVTTRELEPMMHANGIKSLHKV